MKRFVCLLLVLVLMVSISAPAFAAYPTAKLRTAKTLRVKRGKTATFKFTLRSGSYYKYNGYWRSEFDWYCYRDYNNAKYAQKEIYFTGNINYTLKWAIPKSTPKGLYNINYQTWYRPSIYRTTFYRYTNAWSYLYVK